MPYAPTVNDNSGQIRAQGIMGGMESFTRMLERFQQKQEQNKIFQARAKSAESFVKAHPEAFGGEEAAKHFLEVDPKETPAARYARLTDSISNVAASQQMESHKAMMAARDQEIKARDQEMKARDLEISSLRGKLDQFNQERQRDEAMRAQLKQFSQLDHGVGSGVLKSSVQDRMNTQLHGTTDPMNVPAQEPGQPVAGNDLLRRQVDMFNATGGYLKPSELAIDDSRVMQANAAVERAGNADALARARRETDAAKLEAAGKPPQFVTDPTTGVTLAVHGNQMIPVREATPRHPLIAAIEESVKAKEITPQEAIKYKKEVFRKAGEFSPNNFGTALATALSGQQGQGAAPVAPAIQPIQTPTTQASSAPKRVTTQEEYDALPPGTRYVDPDGNIGVKGGAR